MEIVETLFKPDNNKFALDANIHLFIWYEFAFRDVVAGSLGL